MPRPKGSKNKKKLVQLDSLEVIEAKIAEAEQSVERLSAELKAEKLALKELLKSKELAVKAEADKRAAADKAAVLAAIESSSKSLDEILTFLK